MKKIFFLFVVIAPLLCFSQIKGDSKIIITVQDSTNIHKLVKNSLVKNDFVVKDLPGDTITTYVRKYKGMYVALRSVVSGSRVTMTGFYSLSQIGDFGYENPSKDRKRIIYYVGALTWNLMLKVSREINSNLAFAE